MDLEVNNLNMKINKMNYKHKYLKIRCKLQFIKLEKINVLK